MTENEIILLFQQYLQWKVNELGVLVYVYDCDSILYTTIAPVLVKVHKLVCETGFCTVKWNGQIESIFPISIKVCAGNETLWEFQEMVRRIKRNFAAYCLIVTARYRNRNANSQPFMSPKTFRKFFFSWASHQLIEFRKVCDWCKDSPKLLAGDGTKIGISMQKISIVPIESASKDEVIQIPHKKFDRCFLAYPSNLGSALTEKKN